jgi:hypothetical protein
MDRRSPPVRDKHPFHKELVKLRERSRWADQESFANQTLLSCKGYVKCENGERLPSREVLDRILSRVGADQATATRLIDLWNDAKAKRLGLVGAASQTPTVDCDALAKRIRSETVFVLKQAGVHVKDPTKSVMEKRIAMILKSVLGA